MKTTPNRGKWFGCAALVTAALPLLWFSWQWHSLSVRWGTADPCGMVITKLSEETGFPVRILSSVRKDGAAACWRSMLFGAPTERELNTIHVAKAHELERLWNGGRKDRELALLSAAIYDVDVLVSLFAHDLATAVALTRGLLAEYPDERADVEAAVRQSCARELHETLAHCIKRRSAGVGLSGGL